MIGIITRKELRSLWRDGRLRWTGAMLLLLLSVSTTVGLQTWSRSSSARKQAGHLQRHQWLNRSIVNPHVAAHAGTTLFRPVDPLSAFDTGIDKFAGGSIFLEPHRRTLFAHAAVESATPMGRFAELTAAVLLQSIVPLPIVLLTFPAFAGERERGTLRHLMSLGVHPAKLAIGKIAGSGAPVLLLVMPVLLIAVMTAANPGRAVLLFLAYLFYLAIFTVAGVVISAKSRSSQNALIVLLGLWLLTCFVLPRLAFALAQRAYPAPSAQQFIEEMEEVDAAEITGFMAHRAAIEKRLLAKYQVRTAADLPVSTWGVTLYEREIDSTRRYNAQFARLFDAWEQQQRFVDLVSLTSPPLALRTLSMALTATDVAHFRHFGEAAERYRFELVQTMNQVAVESRMYNASSFSAPPDQRAFPEGERAAYERVGPFSYQLPSASWVLSHAYVPALAMLSWLLALGGVTGIVLRRSGVD